MDVLNKKENPPSASRRNLFQFQTFAEVYSQTPEETSLSNLLNQQHIQQLADKDISASRNRHDTLMMGVLEEGQTIDTKILNEPKQNKEAYGNLDEIIGVNPPTSSKSSRTIEKRTKAVLPPPRINIPRKSKARAYEKLKMLNKGIFTLILLEGKPKTGRPVKVKSRAPKPAKVFRKRKPVAKNLIIQDSETTIQSCNTSNPCSACAESDSCHSMCSSY
ncbi:hypothetical protein O0L34_g7916 [Tuta absoluta]|nr:hypothetical protein O0L34_g7916 [Tuta absoluta]